MNKKREIEKQTSDADFAFELFKNILDAKNEAGKQFLRIGEALTVIQEKKLYTFFNVATFTEFIAIPELGFAWSTAELFKSVYQNFIRRLGFSADEISGVEISKLQKILPVIKAVQDKEAASEWLSMASSLSRSDLGGAVREARGLPPYVAKEESIETYDILDYKSYENYVKAHCCIVCDNTTVDAHHFPISKGAGGSDFKVVPLCRACHSEYHQDPHKFIIKWEEKIFDYFYRAFYEAYKYITKTTEQEV